MVIALFVFQVAQCHGSDHWTAFLGLLWVLELFGNAWLCVYVFTVQRSFGSTLESTFSWRVHVDVCLVATAHAMTGSKFQAMPLF